MAETADTLRRLFTRANVTLSAVVAFGWTFFMGLIGLIVFGAPRALHVPPTTLVGYVLVLLYIRGPLQQVISNLSQLGRGGVALTKLETLGLRLSEDPEPEAPEAAHASMHQTPHRGGGWSWRASPSAFRARRGRPTSCSARSTSCSAPASWSS